MANLAVTLLSFAVVFVTPVLSYYDEGLIKEYIFSNKSYDSSIQPFDSTGKVTIKKGLELRQIIELDEKNQILFSNLQYHWEWTDNRLTWDPSLYGGVNVLRLKSTTVWLPDIMAYNDVRGADRPTSDYHLHLFSNGTIKWNFPVFMKSVCKVYFTYFPFDQQVCPLEFGSTAYDVDSLIVVNSSDSGSTAKFTTNGEFELKDILVRQHTYLFGCCPKPFSVVKFFIVLRRKALFTMYTLMFPCFVLALTTVMGFYLPPHSGEKINVGMNALVGLYVFLLLLQQWMPQQSEEIPLISWFFIITICLLTFSLIVTIYIVSVFYGGQYGYQLGTCFRHFVFQCLAALLRRRKLISNLSGKTQELLDCHEENKRQSFADAMNRGSWMAKIDSLATDNAGFDRSSEEDQAKAVGLMKVFNKDSLAAGLRKRATKPEGNETQDPDLKEVAATKQSLSRITSKIEVFENLQAENEKFYWIEAEWQLAAVIIDRLFFFLFALTTVAVCLGLFIVFPDYSIPEKDLA